MSAIFNFQSLLTVIILLICTCTFSGTFWKCARIGERKSPYIAVCCLILAFFILVNMYDESNGSSEISAPSFPLCVSDPIPVGGFFLVSVPLAWMFYDMAFQPDKDIEPK
nr:hypothetical transcript [Hymenolepis microstoma]